MFGCCVAGGGRKRAVQNTNSAVDSKNKEEPVVKRGRGRVPRATQVQVQDNKVKEEPDTDEAQTNTVNDTFVVPGRRGRKKVTIAPVKVENKDVDDSEPQPADANAVVAAAGDKTDDNSEKTVKEEKEEEKPEVAPAGKSETGNAIIKLRFVQVTHLLWITIASVACTLRVYYIGFQWLGTICKNSSGSHSVP